MSSSELLHEVSIFHLDSRVQKGAEWLLAKLSAGGMIAQEAK